MSQKHKEKLPPVNPNQALLLLVAYCMKKAAMQIDPTKTIMCLTLIVQEAQFKFAERIMRAKLPVFNTAFFVPGMAMLANDKWEDVIAEKLEEKYMSNDPYVYGITNNGVSIATWIVKGDFGKECFQPNVQELMDGEAHGFFVSRAQQYANRTERELQHMIDAMMVASDV
ncbi:MAG: hypothetical protein HQL67_11095 [Magnetococcales bacterium]|nr:hypothetical protein [Magnetococcales bacterium]